MSLFIDPAVCIDCGACEYGCPTEAIHPSDATHSRFWISTFLCNDCGWCPTVCPVDCILVDPDSIICHGRGCPVSPAGSGPFAGWECTELVRLCSCGSVLWRRSDHDEWTCPKCGLDSQVGCPKTLSLGKGKTDQKPLRRPVAELYASRPR